MAVSALLAALVAACTVETPSPPQGVDVPEGPCGHALVVASTPKQYGSSSIGVVGFDGKQLAPAIVSSASREPGLSAALSGDVVLPTMPTASGIVLIDRQNANITWLDPPSAKVTHQLPTGGRTNPHDYVEITERKAYVSRFDVDSTSTQPLGRGGDVVTIDPTKPALVSSIPIAEHLGLPPGLQAHPDRMVRTSSEIVVLVQTYSDDFKTSGNSFLVRIDPGTDNVIGVLPLPGLAGCAALALSPSGKELAVGCSGTFGGSSTPSLATAGVAVLDAASYQRIRTWSATELMGEPPAFALAFASENALLVPTFGAMDTSTSDRILRAEIASGAVTQVASSQAAFDFGEVRCAPLCGACFLADAGAARVMRFSVDAQGAVTGERDVHVDNGGLAPRYIGIY